MKKVGLLVNPVAGMGGSVGLKGTDGLAEEAAKRGALPRSPKRAEAALKALLPMQDELLILCASGDMGQSEAESLGFDTEAVYAPADPTTAADTVAAARAIENAGAEILLFAGGDGTARNLVTAGVAIPVIGIPAGVKIHSPVYAVRPEAAGELAARVLKGERKRTKQAEVMDIDEDAWRADQVSTKLYGLLTVPDDRSLLQHGKAASPASEASQHALIASEMAKRMKKGCYYLIGPGTTTKALLDGLGLEGTVLGVDLVEDGKLVQKDLCEADILQRIAERETFLVLTPTGGQGFLLGRGNQQISGEVVKRLGKDHLFVLATKEKLFSLQGRPLLADTGDLEADALLSGYMRAITGLGEEQMIRVSGT
ncbi:MAG: ATP-NAD kinase family protein [Firmicutes bacterium]|nr:ATP-NAD kinase family protein [Bacillota bacterium]